MVHFRNLDSLSNCSGWKWTQQEIKCGNASCYQVGFFILFKGEKLYTKDYLPNRANTESFRKSMVTLSMRDWCEFFFSDIPQTAVSVWCGLLKIQL